MAFLRQHWQALLITVVVLGLATAAAGWIETTIRGLGDDAEAEAAATTDGRGAQHERRFTLSGPRLGVTLEETEDGLVVDDVLRGSAAAEAGIESGDRLVRIDGVEVATLDEARAALAAVEGEAFDVGLERDGAPRTVLVERDQPRQVRRGPDFRDRMPDGWRDFDFPALPDLGGPRLGLVVEESEDGLVVARVERGSRAEEAGIAAGDVILEADGKQVSTADELRDIVQAHEPGDAIELVLREGAQQRAVSVQVTEGEPFARLLPFEEPGWFGGFELPRLEGLSADELRELRNELARALESGGERLGELRDELLRHLDELIERATAREGGGSEMGLDAQA